MEDTLHIDLDSTDAVQEAARGADALEHLIKVIDRFGKTEVDNRAGKTLERLGVLGRGAGSAIASGMSGTLDATLKAVAGVTKLSSVLELATKRAAALKKEEDKAFDAAVKAANKTPEHLKVGQEKGTVSTFAAVTGLVQKLLGPQAATGLRAGAVMLSEASEKMAPWMPLLEKGGSLLMSGGKLLAVGSLALAAAGAAVALAIGAVVVKLLQAGSELAIKSTTFRETTVDALDAVLKDTARAQTTYDAAIEVAVKLGLDKEDTLQRVKSLVTTGFRDEEITLILTAVADVRVAKGDEAGNALQKTLEKIKAKGKFDGEAVNALAEAGIQSELVVQALAKKLGLSIAQVEGKLKAGQISVADGVKAILEAANQQTGGAAEKASKSIPKLIESAKTLFESLFDSVDIGPIKEVLGTLIGIVSGPEGAALKGAVNNLFGTIFKVLMAPFQGPEGEKRMTRFITALTDGMNGAARIIEKFGPPILEFVDGLSKFFDKSGSTSGGSWLMSIVTGILQMSAALGGLDYAPLVAWLDGLLTKINAIDFSGAASGIAQKIIGGLVAGLLGGGPLVAQVLAGIVSSAINAAAGPKGADAHSPSKKTEKIGSQLGEGPVVGMMRWRDKVGGAAESLALRATSAMGAANDNGGAGSAAAPAASSGGGPTIIVHVHMAPGAAGDPQAVREAAAEGTYEGFLRHMNRFARGGLRRTGT